MRILVNEAEFDFQTHKNGFNNRIDINSNTSVNDVKAHFFETLEEIGSIIKISNDIEINELQNLCNQSDVIFASFHEEPPISIACRLLKHTKGGLMLTGGFLNRWTFMKTTMNIVTSQQQAKQLNKALGKSAPLVAVFTPRINANYFRLPSEIEKKKAKKLNKLKEETFHLIFAGRFIANKGITQIIRALNLLTEKKIRLTLVGNFEQDFFIYQSNATHATFPVFFEREVINKTQNFELVCLPSMKHEDLRDLFWSADCFVYPSFHEDENFGLAPREAILSGIPVIVSDFCGLGNLVNCNGIAIKTYPSLGGVRYSIKELANAINIISNRIIEENKKIAFKDSKFVQNECSIKISKKELKTAMEQLLKMPVREKPEGGWRSKIRFDNWMNDAPKIFKDTILKAEEKQPDGLYVDGVGYANESCFSESHFLKAIQSIYTTYPNIPQAKKNSTYRGFWRLSLLESENAVIEFGFPGPRVLRFNQTEFELLKSCTTFLSNNDILFKPKDDKQLIVIQKILELGYLVPDDF